MRIKSILAVYKKEMLEILRDKKTLVLMILVPIVLYPLIMIGSMQLGISMTKTDPNVTINIASNINDEVLLENIKTHSEPTFHLVSVDDAELALNDQVIHAYLESNEMGEYTILFNASKESSIKAQSELTKVLNDYKTSLVKNNIEAIGQDAQSILEPITIQTKNIANNESMVGMLLGMLLPFLLITVIMMGAMYPAIDITAGEKERGTLETMLTLPISNIECISAKFLAVSTIACVTGLLNLISIGISGGFMMSQLSLINESIQFNLVGLLPGILVTVACILIFSLFISAIVMCVCMFANSFKEASNYITPLTLIVMVPCMLTLSPDVSLSIQTVAIPVLNIALLIKGSLGGNIDFYLTSITLILNAMYAFLAIYGLTRIFKSESMLFKDGNSSMFELRSNIKAREVPQIVDTFLLYLISMFILIYVGGYFQVKLGFNGLMVNQLIVFTCCFGTCLYLKSDIKKTFQFHFPKILNFVSAVILIVGMIVVNLVFSTYWLGSNTELNEVAQNLTTFLTPPNAWMGYFVVAFLPAIAEEMFFRGFILSSFSKRLKPWMAIVGSAVLFGIFHLNFVQMIPAFFTGLVLAYITYQSKSIYPAMLMHFINNAFAQSSMIFPEKFTFIDAFFTDVTQGEVLGLTLIGIGIIGIGYSFTRWVNLPHAFLEKLWKKEQVSEVIEAGVLEEVKSEEVIETEASEEIKNEEVIETEALEEIKNEEVIETEVLEEIKSEEVIETEVSEEIKSEEVIETEILEEIKSEEVKESNVFEEIKTEEVTTDISNVEMINKDTNEETRKSDQDKVE